MSNIFEAHIRPYLNIGDVNKRINAKSNYNALNINYLMGNSISYINNGSKPKTDAPAIYSRGCGNWKLYHP